MMNSNTLETLSQETTRLLNVQSKILTDALTVDNFLSQNQVSNEKTIGVKEVTSWIDNLKNELQKLDKLEMVLAVIGTMKAGKSTTINAIVGMEILPNRETAMTTLPTLIRNKHGQTQPVLMIRKVQPLLELGKKVAEKLQGLDEAAINQIDLQGIDDGKKLITHLLAHGGYQFSTEYEGSEAIFEFLKHLNDVMRLAKDENIAIEPPYGEYENVDDLPVIEVEFCHLQGNQDMAHGSLAILDTPGPNEFGQSAALRQVFEMQLNKASAILLVTDFTQMKTEADQKVREELEKIKEHLSPDRLAVVVNKYDQKNKNSMSLDEIKSYVAGSLMRDTVENGQVFPVSSYFAYLANRAKTFLEHNDHLPDYKKEPWVADFYDTALGTSWDEEDINDTDKIKKCIKKLWEKSLFEEPIEKVIKEAHANAAKISLKSAISHLDGCTEFSNTLNLRLPTMTADIDNIKEWMQNLQNDIDRCESVKSDVGSMTNKFLSSLEGEMRKVMVNQQANIVNVIEDFFKSGKMMEKSKQDQMLAASMKAVDSPNLRNAVRGIVSEFLPFGDIIKDQDKRFRSQQKEKIEQLFDPNSPRITCHNENEANQLIRDVNGAISTIFNKADNQLKSVTNQLIHSTTEAISKQINTVVAETLEKAKAQLGDNGINVSFKLTNIDLTIANIDESQLFNAGYHKNTETKYGTRDSDSIGSGASRFFGGIFGKHDWGRETYSYQETTHIVDLEKIKTQIIGQLKKQEEAITHQTRAYLHGIFQPKIDSHLEGLVEYLERYRGVLGDGLESHKLKQDDKTKLKNQLEKLAERQLVLKNDIEENRKIVAVIGT